MHAERLPNNPIIRPDMVPGDDGANINGPSLIRVPDWLPHPLGRYYLYFAHHGGQYIRLAVADALAGPWRMHAPGTLRLEQTPFHGHIASPDVHVDHGRRQIRMYYHGCLSDGAGQWIGQRTALALSDDGLSFHSRTEDLGPSYMRMFVWRDRWYSLAMPGQFFRSDDGLTGFEPGPQVFPYVGQEQRVRHLAVHVAGDTLQVIYSRVGDSPERLLQTKINLGDDWEQWRPVEQSELLAPETTQEGADLPLAPSRSGASPGRTRQLRDPALYAEDGRLWLLYAVAGESGIALAELTPAPEV